MLAHYDGANWIGITGVGASGKYAYHFRLLHGTTGATDNVWAAGSGDVEELYRFNGTKWLLMTTSPHRARALWATGSDEVWVAEDDGFVAHWDGQSWQETQPGGTVDGIYGFSNTDIWIAGSSVRHFDGTSWTNKGGGGVGIWGPSSGDMWTADGAHLVANKWVPLAGTSNGIVQTIGASASNLLFLGFGPSFNPKSYYQQGNVFAQSAFPGLGDVTTVTQPGVAWPVSPTDYWVGVTTLQHGNPAGTPQEFTEKGASFDFLYNYVANDAYHFDCENNVLYRTKPSRVHIPGGPECWLAMTGADADGRVWLAFNDEPRGLWIYDGSWHAVPLPADATNFDDFQVRGHEAWLLNRDENDAFNSQAVAYRFNGHGWDTYRLGAANYEDVYSVCITSDEQVSFKQLGNSDSCVANLIFKP